MSWTEGKHVFVLQILQSPGLEGCPLQNLHISSCAVMHLHNMKLRCSIERKRSNQDAASSKMPSGKHLRCHHQDFPGYAFLIREKNILLWQGAQ